MGYHQKETKTKMVKLFLSAIMAIIVSTAYSASAAELASRPFDAEIDYQISREAWVKTTTARVDITINMTLGREGLAKARKNMLDNLQSLGKVDWQLTNFNRTRDQSGLEQVSATATARFSENNLDGLRDRAIAVSKPGSNYVVSAIDFTPSLAEVETARAALRLDLMQAIKQHLTEVKKLYPEQNYQITSMNFSSDELAPMATPRVMMAMGNVAKAGAVAPLSVSQKIVLSANVIFAVLNPKQ